MKTKNMIAGVYIAIAIATFTHTSWSAANVFQGVAPKATTVFSWVTAELVWWYIQGALVAIAIDVGMLVAADSIAKNPSRTMLLAFILAALASAYTQLLYATHHASIFTFGAGVTPAWQARLQEAIDARIILMPLALPAFAIIYTISAHSVEDYPQEVIKVTSTADPKKHFNVNKWETEDGLFFRGLNGEVYGPYDSDGIRERTLKTHVKRYQKQLPPGEVEQATEVYVAVKEDIEV